MVSRRKVVASDLQLPGFDEICVAVSIFETLPGQNNTSPELVLCEKPQNVQRVLSSGALHSK